MSIDFKKISERLSGVKKANIDFDKISARLPKPAPEPAAIPKYDAMKSAKDMFAGKAYQVYQKEISPVQGVSVDTSRFPIVPKTPIANFNLGTSGSTPAISNKSYGPFSVTFGGVRAITDVGAGVVASGINKLMPASQQVSTKDLISSTKEMIKADIESGGTASIDKAAKMYLDSRGISSGQKQPDLQDVVVLGVMGFNNIFGDPTIGLGEIKAVKEFVIWKKGGTIEKPLAEGAFSKFGRKTANIFLSEDVKIKLTPKDKSVTMAGYIKRGSSGELLTFESDIKAIANTISEETGKEIKPIVSGENLKLAVVREPIVEKTIEPISITGKSVKPSETVNKKIEFTQGINEQSEKEARILEELSIAKGGSRNYIRDEDGFLQKVVGEKSTIPSYIPENLRSTKLIQSTLEKIYNGELPTKVDEIRLYNVISEQMFPKEKIADKNIDLDDIKFEKSQAPILKTEKVSLDSIKTGDDFVEATKDLSEGITSKTKQPVLLGRDGDDIYIIDGNHRVAEALQRGEKDIIATFDEEAYKQLSSSDKLKDKGGYVQREAPKEGKTKIMQTPEQYRFMKSVSPDMNFVMKNSSKYNGYFKPKGLGGKEEIGMNRQLYKRGKEETKEAYQTRIGKTMAHEIGHFVDYLPDKNIKRGNLNGRLLVVSDFKKNFVGDPSLIDKRKKIMQKISEINNDPVLVDSQVEKMTAPLYKEIEGLNREIQFVNARFKDELIKLSKEWKPWEIGVDKKYDAYRSSAPELYADFVSVLFNDPALAEKTAPSFYNEFFRSLDKKPEVQKEFLSIQAELMGDRPTLMKKRWEMLKDSGMNAQGKFAKMVEEKQAIKKDPWISAMKRDMWYQHYWTSKKAPVVGQQMEILDRGFTNAIHLFGDNYLKPIQKRMKEMNIDSNELDALLKLERIALDTTREDVANLKGLDKSTAEDVLKELSAILGEEKAKAIVEIGGELRKALKEVQLKYEDLWSEETKKLINSNNFYAPFNVIFNESQNIPYFIKQSKGNIDKDFNAVTNTLLRSKAVIHYGEKNLIKKTIIDSFIETNDKDLAKAVVSRFKDTKGNIQRVVKPAPAGFDIVEIKRNGKLESYYLPDDIAHSLNQDNIGELAAALKIFAEINKPFKKLYTELNPTFQVVNFFIRDWGQASLFFSPEWTRAQLGLSNKGLNIIANNTYRQIFSTINQVKYYKKALTNLKEKNLFQRYNPLIQEALKSHIIEIDGSGMYKLDTTNLTKQDEMAFDYILQAMGLTPYKKGKIKRVGEIIRGVGQTLEETPKLAASLYMEDLGLMSGKESEQYKSIIRNYVGSQNFWKQGRLNKNTSAVLMFYNPIIMGMENLGKKAFIKDAAGKGSRNAFWWRMIRKAIIPALVSVAAEEGFFDGDSEGTDRISYKIKSVKEYLKNNYYTFPLSASEETGKVKGIYIPLDEDSRFIYAITRHLSRLALHSEDKSIRARALTDILAYTGGQVPGVSPAISIGSTWLTAMSGGNPYDKFRQQHLFFANEEKLPAMEKAKIVAKWTLNQNGNIRINVHDSVDKMTKYEKTIQSSPVIKAFYRITDSAEYEQDQWLVKKAGEKTSMALRSKNKELGEIAKSINNGEKIDINEKIFNMAKERLGPDSVDNKKLNEEVKLLASALQEKYIDLYGNIHYRTLQNINNNEKEFVLIGIWDRGYMSAEKMTKFLNDSVALGIISKEVAGNVAQEINKK